MKMKIKIALAGDHWMDQTNGTDVGNGDGLVFYVNSKQLRVLNEDTFLRSNEFWYNEPALQTSIMCDMAEFVMIDGAIRLARRSLVTFQQGFMKSVTDAMNTQSVSLSRLCSVTGIHETIFQALIDCDMDIYEDFIKSASRLLQLRRYVRPEEIGK